MLNKEELSVVRKALPKGSYEEIKKKLNRKSAVVIRMILTLPERYDPEVIDEALMIIKNAEEKINFQKKQVKNIKLI